MIIAIVYADAIRMTVKMDGIFVTVNNVIPVLLY